jgi:NADPH-dependent glutamate synthase beta subunit-like oxidoreductase/NAD-dependent dihydropyrimidine dehydrogenase PreA subunit
MVVTTKTPEIDSIRRYAMELMLAGHPQDCLGELQAVAQYLGITESHLRRQPRNIPINDRNPLFIHDLDRCILCGRCIRACYELQGVGVLSFNKRGRETYVGTAFNRPLVDAGCRFCGACVEVCPSGALRDKPELLEVGTTPEEALVPCKHACPAGIDAPRYIRLISEGKYAESLAVVREKAPFPNMLGHVCNHPCEVVCRRKELNDPIAIRALKRFAAERDNGLWKKNSNKLPSTGKRVAVVGSGPAGLTAAFYLAKLGHEATVFEALPVVGGMMRVAIPEYRLPSEVRDAEIEEIRQMGVDIKTNSRIDSVDKLLDRGYQAVFLAVGAHQGTNMGVGGEDSQRVMDAITFLRQVSLGQKVNTGDKVAVIGGGNVTIDAARTALRLGAKKVNILYRRTRTEMPALPEEVEGALEEGVEITFLAAPKRIWNENGVVRLECLRMELGEPDASGRRRPVPVEGSEFAADYNTIIAAIGQRSEIPDGFQVATERGAIKTDDDVITNREGVFAGGDCVTGPATVIQAIAAGRKGAVAIDRYLGGKGVIDEQLAPVEKPFFCKGLKPEFAHQHLYEMSSMPVERRLTSFDEIELGYDEETAVMESARCLRCDFRTRISSVPLPPKK